MVTINMSNEEARTYIKLFSKYITPGAEYVQMKDGRKVYFTKMTDEEAQFIAIWMKHIETEAAKNRQNKNH